MAITATSVTPENTLEEFRIQFNKLVIDVDGVAAGNTFTSSIIFEGETADESETTLLATDPTADRTITLPDASGTVITTGNSDAPTTTTTTGDVDFVLVDDGGTLKKITRGNLGIGGAVSADDIDTGDAAVNIVTSTGNITIDAQGSDTDIIFKGTDGSSDITPLTLDMSEAGLAIFTGDVSLADEKKLILGTNNDISFKYNETSTNTLMISSDVDDAALGIIFQADAGADAGDEWKMNFANGGTFTFGNDIASAGTHEILLTITPNSTAANSTHAFIGKISASSTITATGGVIVPDDGDVGSASATDAMQISSGGIVTFKDDIKIKDGGTIGSATTAGAITIASDGIVTLVDDLVLKDACTIGTATTAGAIAIAADGTVNLATAGATVNSTVISTVGTQTIWVPACAMRPTVTNGCAVITDAETTSGRPDMQVLDFDPSSDEHAQFQICFPKSWNESTITFSVYWTTTATDTDGVAWGLQGVAVSDNDTIDVAYGTAVVVTDDALSAAEDLCVTATSGAVTIAGTPAVGDICYFRIFRDVSDANDDMAEDARLIGVKIFFTTDAANDA